MNDSSNLVARQSAATQQQYVKDSDSAEYGEEDELLYGSVEFGDLDRVKYELDKERDKKYVVTFSVAFWRLGTFSVFMALILELSGLWIRRYMHSHS